MAPVSALVLYAVLWFLTFLVVLPIRLKTQGDTGHIVPGTQAGAPENPQLKKRALIATGVAALLWALIFWIIVAEIITVRDIDFMGTLNPEPEALQDY